MYIDSARPPLQEYITKLNQRCLFQTDDSKYKVGLDFWRRLYYENLKKPFFCILVVYPQKFENCEIRQDQEVRQKNVIFWIY